MVRTSWTLCLTAAVLSCVLLGTAQAQADPIYVLQPGASYYAPPPTVSYYTPPVVYAPAPQVSYYYGAPVSYYTPTVSYYAPPVSYYAPRVSYYAPPVSYYSAPVAVTTTRYGLFGRPRVSTTYYPPAYIGR